MVDFENMEYISEKIGKRSRLQQEKLKQTETESGDEGQGEFDWSELSN